MVKYFSLLLLVAIFFQIILGAWVRLTGSGMSCPDWPLCYGMIFPTYEKIKSIENIDYTYFQIFFLLIFIAATISCVMLGNDDGFWDFLFVYRTTTSVRGQIPTPVASEEELSAQRITDYILLQSWHL